MGIDKDNEAAGGGGPGPRTVEDKSLAAEHARLLERVVSRRDAVLRFEQFLSAETAWKTAPASTRFHLPEPDGLLRHSVNVATTLLKLRECLAPDLSEESCVICGLYHDLGKAGMPGRPYYIANPDRWQATHRGRPYVVNPALVHLDIPTRGLLLLAGRVGLTEEEAQAIRYHDGQYVEENHSVAHRECRLTRLLQYADNWAGGVLEGGENDLG